MQMTLSRLYSSIISMVKNNNIKFFVYCKLIYLCYVKGRLLSVTSLRDQFLTSKMETWHWVNFFSKTGKFKIAHPEYKFKAEIPAEIR